MRTPRAHRHYGPVPARIDVQDHHRRRGHRAEMATPNISSPGVIDIGHRTIPNYGGFDRHRTDVAGVRQFVQHDLRRTGQPDAAARPDPGRRAVRHRARLPDRGHSTVSGSVPPTVNLAERTEDGFGQGKVLVSPFGMAMAAATVAAGKTLCRN